MANSNSYHKSLTLLPRILEMINKGCIPSDIASKLDFSRSRRSYHIKNAIESGYVVETFRDTFRVYELTEPGKNFLAMYQQQQQTTSKICRAENVRFKAPVYKMPYKPVDWPKIEMHNWNQYTTEVDGIKVKLNHGDNPTIEFLPELCCTIHLFLRTLSIRLHLHSNKHVIQ